MGGLHKRTSCIFSIAVVSQQARMATVCFFNYIIELLTEDGDWKEAYSGATWREEIRKEEHFGLVGGAGRVAASVARHGPARHRVRIVAKTSLCVPEREQGKQEKLPFEIRCLETYLMWKFRTLAARMSNMRERFSEANQFADHKYPDISLLDQPLNFQLNCVKSVNVKNHEDDVKAAGQRFENQTTTLCIYTKEEQEEVYAQIFKDLGVEPLQTVMVACSKPPKNNEFEDVVFDIDSPFMRAYQLRVQYEYMDGWDIITADTVSTQVNSIKDMNKSDDELRKYLNQILLSCHPDKTVDLTAGQAHGFFKVIEQWVGRRAEKELMSLPEASPLNPHVQNALKCRDWMQQHDGRLPIQDQILSKADSLEQLQEEKKTASMIVNWRRGRSESGRLRIPPQNKRNVYLVILRDFPIFAEFCYGSTTKSRNRAEKANYYLRKGCGVTEARKKFTHLIHFHGTCQFCSKDLPEYKFLDNYLRGGSSSSEQTLLHGVEPAYAKWLKELHDSNVGKMNAQIKKATLKRTEKLHATGTRKKRNCAEKGSSSSSPESSSSTLKEEDGEFEDEDVHSTTTSTRV